MEVRGTSIKKENVMSVRTKQTAKYADCISSHKHTNIKYPFLFAVSSIFLLCFLSFAYSENISTLNNSSYKNTTQNFNKQVVCGNGVCEVAEDSVNCPVDCKKKLVDFEVNLPTEDLESGQTYSYIYTIQNNDKIPLSINIRSTGIISELININETIKLDSTAVASSSFIIETYGKQGIYQGEIEVSYGSKKDYYPIILNVKNNGDSGSKLKGTVTLKILNKEVIMSSKINYQVQYGYSSTADEIKKINVKYGLYSAGNLTPIISEEKEIEINKTYSSLNTFDISKYSLLAGDYYITVETSDTDFPGITVDTFKITDILLTSKQLKYALFGALGIFIIFIIIFSIVKYKKYVESKSRYLLPNLSKIPSQTEDSFWIGKIGQTEHRAYFDPSKLTTHMLVAGSTGSGKSVTASILVEEALLRKIPVVVFDPTAQWTGFVKACNDDNLLKKFKQFGMSTDDVRPFKGLIYHVKTPDIKLDFKKYMNPGEVTVFNLNDLKGEAYDTAVGNIINTMFTIHWEEDPELRLLVVFDEVHRLLTANGGKVGYLALEKACREFRKWGIGLIMVSQVSSDFKEAVGGNVLTEIQLNTKSMTDIEKIKSKYGEEFAKRITRMGIGVGIVQNPHYNDGRPWFVSFRPTLHSPHKIVEEELELYDTYSRELDSMEERVSEKKKSGMDTMDIELELKLARDKLKEGRFKMVEVYLDSLRNSMTKM